MFQRGCCRCSRQSREIIGYSRQKSWSCRKCRGSFGLENRRECLLPRLFQVGTFLTQLCGASQLALFLGRFAETLFILQCIFCNTIFEAVCATAVGISRISSAWRADFFQRYSTKQLVSLNACRTHAAPLLPRLGSKKLRSSNGAFIESPLGDYRVPTTKTDEFQQKQPEMHVLMSCDSPNRIPGR